MGFLNARIFLFGLAGCVLGSSSSRPALTPYTGGVTSVCVPFLRCCRLYNAFNLRMPILSNVHLNDYNDLADLPHYAPISLTDSEHQASQMG